MKKRNVMSLAVYTMALVCTLFLWAGSVRAEEKKPEIKSVEYQGNEKVEVEFSGKVSWKKAKVTVTDTEGTVYKTKILEKDRDDITFRVKKAVEGKDYRFTISGVGVWKSGTYTSVSGEFRIAGSEEILVEKVEYDARDKEVTIEFQSAVKWKKAKVSIKNGKKEMVKRIAEKDRNEIEVKVKALTAGKIYTYTITGIARKGTKKYQTIKGTFVA